ncbi:anti-sigma F factor [Virgibacillus profundi]|uniref:Anti-sigma F factor n=1 Tax=Virgibacillus profundi TaxID=2024555 RepID=A0A2A2IEH0_9BACI|nr:anti-sigma F factor [Virgibacillus profundi]PAV29550.1 anti-sigma F factor [Virgibacillus profundi]PXY53720.1 anti-sigma F factor [Virgibacillus profundi]
MRNEMFVEFSSVSENEAFARVTVGAFITQLDPTMDELTEIKTVVSEAVTNSIIHGYNNEAHHKISINCVIYDGEIELTIKDNGIGIGDIDEALQPLYTSKPELERSGMGFTIIENFMDSVEVISTPGKGTTVFMTKQLMKSKTVSK